MPDLAIHPLTPDRWDDLVALFETDSVTRMCWCMSPRLSSAELRAASHADRRELLCGVVKRKPGRPLMRIALARPTTRTSATPKPAAIKPGLSKPKGSKR